MTREVSSSLAIFFLPLLSLSSSLETKVAVVSSSTGGAGYGSLRKVIMEAYACQKLKEL
ncbi:unnamed protein product [Citrullus colocynthis]|uniref:Uncharacterized protein n=1 Tax=Citrullus colocynthis TaxID=252529 RepID=A0ABP0Z3S8_9ROSI